ncbi:uncharacterized protein CLUP02_01417 [Colletotrichum lupini]|uniref:Uncharacterized protein n=1 Tax=Colletotrichum lupini TaxID=145971 RepID=A0A9Q8W9X2_9PEZI|nr:uncharacterized protein CLUP02_01417 [Colletotrichum lupini]UQC74765.1 hypothetical protein CLUP02_01417 [Colletotrichum lupini]
MAYDLSEQSSGFAIHIIKYLTKRKKNPFQKRRRA